MSNPYLSQYTTSTGGLGAQAVAYAHSLLGIPYLWGGTTTAGFDCSGLVLFVYKHFGVTLPRTSQEQATDRSQLMNVDRNSLQPGDLIFYNEPGEGPNSHVAIYAGGGQQIAAPHSGTVVQVQGVDWAHFASAGRVIGAGSGGVQPAAYIPGAGTTPVDQSSGVAVPVGWHIPGTPWDIPTPGDAVKGVEGAAAGLGRAITRTAIMLPLVLGGAALVVFGFIRTTNGLKGQPT